MREADAKEMLRRAGLRATGARIRLVGLLAASRAPVDAQSILDRLGEGADRVTVYRTLGALVEAGLAHRVDPGDRVFRFRLTDHSRCESDDPRHAGAKHDHEHPHLVCDSCGAVECMDDADVVIRHRDAGARTAGPWGASPGTWVVKQQSVTVRGTCGRCVGAGGGGERRVRKSRPSTGRSPERPR
ncbi:MAG: transcriptional repressor [Phycisphaerae bacterium]|nr:transcriptional repressor [Phycisphaerae bacterium]